MVEHGRLGGPRGAHVVVHGDAVEELCALRRVEPSACSSISRRPRCTWPSSRPSSVGANAGPRPSSTRPSDVVEERSCEQQVAAQPRMELRRLAAERRDADRVLEQPAGVRVVAVRRRRIRRQVARRASTAPTVARSPACDTSATRNSRNPPSSSPSRRSAGVSVAGSTSGRLERAHVELKPVAELLDAAEHANSVALREPPVEQLDVVPDARSMRPVESTSSSARYGAPDFVRSFRFIATAYTASTTRSSCSSAIVIG